ncbi:MAG: sortase [Fusicatenibacter sp.]
MRNRNKKANGRKQKGFFWITTGLLLIAAALLLAAYNLYYDLRAEQSSGQVISQLKEALHQKDAAEVSESPSGEQEWVVSEEKSDLPDYVLCPDMEMPVETISGSDYIGVLEIPALGLSLPVFSEWSYPGLKIAPCRYSGSAYQKNLIICGHNYTSHFGNLKKLSEGDIATFTDMNGNVFTYKMTERETLQPFSTEEMESGDWDLTLFTCTIGGQSRVTVRFELEF